MSKILTNSDEVIRSKVKLKEYLQDALDEVSNDYIEVSHDVTINIIDALDYIRKYRNILLCINEICKERKKY